MISANRGATFTGNAGVENIATHLADAVLHGRLGEDAQRKKILIVDDEASIRSTLLRMLQRISGGSLKIASVPSATEALEMLNHMEFDLVVIDDIMPGMNGWALAAKIKKRSRAKVLFVPGIRYLAELAGSPFDFYLEKPFNLKSLKGVIEEIFEGD
jgi:CheY-like chemotaxis protein